MFITMKTKIRLMLLFLTHKNIYIINFIIVVEITKAMWFDI